MEGEQCHKRQNTVPPSAFGKTKPESSADFQVGRISEKKNNAESSINVLT